NRLRRAIEAALGALTLLAPDPAKRFEAAQAVFKSRDANALPALEAALAKETDTRVKRAFQQARAAVLMVQPTAGEADKLLAIATIRERSDQEARALLGSLPGDLPPNVRRAANEAITAIDQHLERWRQVQNLWYGISLGSVLLLAAIG